MNKESGQNNFERYEDIPEIEDGLVEAWLPKKDPPPYPQFHRDTRIQEDVYVEELQDRADSLRINPPDRFIVVEKRQFIPTESKSWLDMLREKVWKKKNQ